MISSFLLLRKHVISFCDAPVQNDADIYVSILEGVTNIHSELRVFVRGHP